MKNVRIFFTLSSALIVAASVYGVSADAQKSDLDQCIAGGLSKAECACEAALQKGTQKALRDFLKLYRNADTACNALASTAILTEDNNNDGEIGNSPSGSSSSSSSGASSNGGSSNGGSSNGGSSDGNPGNNKSVGHAGESPNGHDFGNGQKGKSE